jgi:hypothetical protein
MAAGFGFVQIVEQVEVEWIFDIQFNVEYVISNAYHIVKVRDWLLALSSTRRASAANDMQTHNYNFPLEKIRLRNQ